MIVFARKWKHTSTALRLTLERGRGGERWCNSKPVSSKFKSFASHSRSSNNGKFCCCKINSKKLKVILVSNNRLPYLLYTCINSEKLLNKSVFSIFKQLISYHVIFFLIFFQYFGMMRQLNLKRNSQKKNKK